MKWLSDFITSVIPGEVKLALTLGFVAAAIGLGWYVHHRIDLAGYNRCQAEVLHATDVAKDKAQANVTKVEKTYDEKIKSIQEAPDNHDLAGPLTSRAIDSLQ